MKALFLVAFCSFLSLGTWAQNKEARQPDSSRKTLIVDAACGQCQFKMKGKGCNLAVRMDGKSYFVDGTDIDAHGDAHAEDGFCNAVRKAKVQGEIVNNRFRASYFELLPEEKKEKAN